MTTAVNSIEPLAFTASGGIFSVPAISHWESFSFQGRHVDLLPTIDSKRDRTIRVSPELRNLYEVVDARGRQLFESIPLAIDRVPGPSFDRRFKILQQFEGVVAELTGDSIWANMRDLTSPDKDEEIQEIFLSDIPEADRPILRPGIVFYWTIGFAYSRGGQKSRTSEIRVRRTPEWTQKKLESIRKKAAAEFRRQASLDDAVQSAG